MPTYIYDKIVTPPIDRQSLSKVARISYWKAYGEEPPGWLVGPRGSQREPLHPRGGVYRPEAVYKN
jgi:hypothetical protein